MLEFGIVSGVVVVFVFVIVLMIIGLLSQPDRRSEDFFEGLLCEQAIHGKYRVKYNTGDWTQRFHYKTALNYAEIFGGTVHRHEKMDEEGKDAKR